MPFSLTAVEYAGFDMLLTPTNLESVLDHELLGAPMPQGKRLLGIEVEHLLLHHETSESAPVGFCRQFLQRLAEVMGGEKFFDGEVLNRVQGEDFALTMEPGGQLEVATLPYASLMEIEPVMQRILGQIRGELEATDYRLVSLGHAPITKVDDIELLPRQRYRIMDAAMPVRGELVRHMMRGTAGVQVAYDVEDVVDAGRKMALLYRLSPLLMAVTANSRQIGGKDSGHASFRHRVWWFTDHDRTGVPQGCLHAETAVEGYKRFALRATALFLQRDVGLVAAPAEPFEELVAKGGITKDDLLLHLSSLFPLVRLRNYLEVRCLDAVEWPLARGVLALLSGIVYCPNATKRAEALSEELVLDDPKALRDFHLRAAQLGLDCTSPAGTSFREMLTELVRCSRSTLGGDSCDWASADYLDVLT